MKTKTVKMKLTTREAIQELEAIVRAHKLSARAGGISETSAAWAIAALTMAIHALKQSQPHCRCSRPVRGESLIP